MTARRRLNQMRFCECRHGQGAHRNGVGPCVGERMIKGVWQSCTCMAFVQETPEPDGASYDDAGRPAEGKEVRSD